MSHSLATRNFCPKNHPVESARQPVLTLVDDNCGGVSSASEAARVNFLFLEEKEKLTPSSAVPLAAASDAEDDAREEGADDDDEPTESENEGDGGTAKEEQVLRRSAETSAALSG